VRQFTVRGQSAREAMEQIRQMYGEEAVIYSHRPVKIGGVLGMFAKAGVEITGSVGDAETMAGPKTRERAERERLRNEREKLVEVSSGRTYQRLVDEISGLREQLQVGLAAPVIPATDHPTLRHVADLLDRNDFSPSYRDKLLADVRGTHSLDSLDDIDAVEHAVVRAIALGQQVVEPPFHGGAAGGVFILVGPTGVGKTTTVAKLAAMYGVARGGDAPRRVRIITIDNYRIAAREQIAKYGEIMRIPVASAESAAELRKQLALAEDADLVLVDTIGKSPADYERLAEMQTVLSAAGSRRTVHLAVSATTKRRDLLTIFAQFEPFGCEAVVITKLDETTTVGGVLSCLLERQKPVSYLCDGQTVPQDIEPASVVRLLLKLDGFNLKRSELEREFGTPGAAPGIPAVDDVGRANAKRTISSQAGDNSVVEQVR
jgi:flagellar biosynthesis protein FlhF